MVNKGMHNIQILRQNPGKVPDSLNQGKIEKMELAVEQLTDEFKIYGLRGGMQIYKSGYDL